MLSPMKFVSVIIAFVALMIPPESSASSGDPRTIVHEAQSEKMWGTIFKKGAPHLRFFPIVKPFSHNAERSNGAPLYTKTCNTGPFSQCETSVSVGKIAQAQFRPVRWAHVFFRTGHIGLLPFAGLGLASFFLQVLIERVSRLTPRSEFSPERWVVYRCTHDRLKLFYCAPLDRKDRSDRRILPGIRPSICADGGRAHTEICSGLYETFNPF